MKIPTTPRRFLCWYVKRATDAADRKAQQVYLWLCAPKLRHIPSQAAAFEADIRELQSLLAA